MADSLDDIIRIALRGRFFLVPLLCMVIFLIVLDRLHPFSYGDRKNRLTHNCLSLRTPGQSFFDRSTGLQFNPLPIILPLTGRSAG